MADNKERILQKLIFFAKEDPNALAKFLLENLAGGVKGEKGDKGDAGTPGKDAPTIQSLTINVSGGTVSGQATMSEGEPVTITGTFSQA